MAKKDEVLDLFEELESNDEKLKDFVHVYEALSSFLVDFNFLKDLGKITQKDIAQKMGTTQSSISRIESLKTNPSYKQLLKMTDAVGGELLITPMGEMTIQVPYDLQKTVKELALFNNVSVHEYLLDLIRNKIERDQHLFYVTTLKNKAISYEYNYNQIYDLELNEDKKTNSTDSFAA